MQRKKFIVGGTILVLPLLLAVVLSRQKAQLPQLLSVEQQGRLIVVTPDGRFLIQGDDGIVGKIDAFDFSNSKQFFLRAPTSAPELGSHSLVAMSDSQQVAGTGAQFEYAAQSSIGIYALRNPQNFKIVAPLQVAGPALAASPKDDTLAVFNPQGDLCLWDVSSAQLVQRWKNLGSAVTKSGVKTVLVPQALAFAPDASLLARGGQITFTARGSTFGFYKAYAPVVLHDAKNGRVVRTLELPASRATPQPSLSAWPPSIDTLRFSPDGKWLATDCNGSAVAIWNVASGQLHGIWDHPERMTIENGQRTVRHMYGGGGLSFSPDSQWLAAPSNYGQVDVWNLKSGALVRQIVAGGPITFLKNGRLVATNQQHQLMAWTIP